MKWAALPLTACLAASAVTALAQSSDPFPKTIDEAIFRISDKERGRVAALQERILETTGKLDEATMEDYVAPVPKAAEYRPHPSNRSNSSEGSQLHMVAIRGDEFLMGSPPDEPKRHED